MKISVVCPVWEAYGHGNELLNNALNSVKKQNYKDYEIVVTDDSEDNKIADLCDNFDVRYLRNPNQKGMASNTNFAIREAKGDLIKILYQDDCLAEENSLQQIVANFKVNDNWLITSSSNNPHPHFNDWNQNTLGSPSCLTIRNKDPLLFKDLKYFLDLDYYRRMFTKFGNPKILNKIGIIIGLGTYQTTNHLTQEEIQKDYEKYSSAATNDR